MIWIFGDSFAASKDSKSWTSNIGTSTSLATNGSSEYRILKKYLQQQSCIKETDKIIFVHTSPSRIFLRDDRQLSSRALQSHPECDIIINDVYEKKEKEYIKILDSIWDEEYFSDMFGLIIDRLLQIPNSYHLTFFESTRKDILNLNNIWLEHPGTVNHLDEDGNNKVAGIVNQLLSRN